MAKKTNSTFEAMRAIRRQLQRSDDAGLFDGMKAFGKAWREARDADETFPEIRDDIEEPRCEAPASSREATAPAAASKPKKKLPIDKARVLIAELFRNGTTDLTTKAVDDLLAKECKRRGIKTWGWRTTNRALGRE